MKKQGKGGFLYAFNLTAAILILFFAMLIPLLHAAGSLGHSVKMHIDGARSERLGTTTQFAVTIDNASSTPLNAVEFELRFDPSKILITKITPLATLCEDQFVISNSIDNERGVALLQCGTLHPFSAATGTIARIEAIPVGVGSTTIAFGTTTHVLASDGLGSDATGSTTGATFATIF